MRIAALIGWLLGIGIVVLGVSILARNWRPPIDAYPLQGMSISAQNEAIDWPRAKADGVDFAYALATDGAEVRDAAFAGHWMAMHQAEIRRGAILRYSLCAPAQDQADQFVATVPRTDDALPAAIELSIRSDCAARPPVRGVIAGLVALIATVERHTGKPVLLKIDKPFEAIYRPSASIPRNIWGVRRFFAPAYLAQPWRMWQASDLAAVDGVDGRVEWNVVPR
ncbi:GH25 family lysozyme [Sphingomonas japonica]|uniref:Lysozyme n=1 Tax=Sphingomonas japonica TaxID=511662 RepID=A0ABX0U6X3_9SPHN|nr:GH25 family lysozyme [Sphingomonas japonica]NIJ24513.1 lysozyme [Sphingomonas japonica]